MPVKAKEPLRYALPKPLCLVRYGLRGSKVFCRFPQEHRGKHGAMDRTGRMLYWTDLEAGTSCR